MFWAQPLQLDLDLLSFFVVVELRGPFEPERLSPTGPLLIRSSFYLQGHRRAQRSFVGRIANSENSSADFGSVFPRYARTCSRIYDQPRHFLGFGPRRDLQFRFRLPLCLLAVQVQSSMRQHSANHLDQWS